MKISCIVLIALLQTLVSPAQNQYGRQPYKYNSFITRPGITWASETYNTYEFDQQTDKPFDIHGYLINAQKTGKIKSYLNTAFTPEDINQWKTKKITDYYFEISKDYSNQKLQAFTDSTRLIEFHEIFYLQNHQLKSQVISAAPQLKVFTSSGIYIGNTISSFSSINYYATQKQNKKDKVIFLGSTSQTINFDSMETNLGLKKTYGRTLSLALWYDLSKGFNKVIDLKTNDTVASTLIMDFPAFDSSVVYASNDSAYKVKSPPVYNYFSEITVLQDWYYNQTKDIFVNKIPKVFLHIKYYDERQAVYITEKRFEIMF